MKVKMHVHRRELDLLFTVTSVDGNTELGKMKWPNAAQYYQGSKKVKGVDMLILAVPRAAIVDFQDAKEETTDEG